MTLTVSLLGPPRVERDGAPVSFDTRKALALLAYLALAERPHARDALAELLWPGHDDEHARGALRRTLSALRSAIGAEHLDVARERIALAPASRSCVDVHRFRRFAGPGASAADLERAAQLCSGELLEGFALRDSPAFDEWQRLQADGLRRELSAVLDRAADTRAADGDFAGALAHARRRLALDPLQEPAHRLVIRLLAWSGDRAAAVDAYRDCVRLLSAELGVAPLPETTDLYRAISEGDLEPPPEPRPTQVPAAAPRAPRPLVGRGAQWEALVEAHRRASPGGRVVVLEGEPGIGKTRLAETFLEHVREHGASVVAGRAYQEETALPYGPLAEALRARLADGTTWLGDVPARSLAEAARLVGELADARDGLSQPAPIEGPGAEARFLAGVVDTLVGATAGSVPGVLLVDDVQWADEATLSLLGHLGRRLARRPLLVLLTWRAPREPRMRRLAVELGRVSPPEVLRLERLELSEVADLVRSTSLAEGDPALERRLFAETEGVPFLVVEYLAALEAAPERVPEAWPLPAGVQAVIGARVDALDEVARQVLAAGAVLGRSFDLETVRATAGRTEEETVGAVEELVRQGVVEERGTADVAPVGYDFGHDKVRTLVLDELSLARLRLLHRRAADALARPGRLREERAAVVARHRRLAGQDTEAAAEHVLAAGHARRLHANADALEHLRAALALGHPDTARVHAEIGDVETLVGDYAGALASYEAAAATSAPEALAELERRLAGVHHRRGEWGLAAARLSAALDATDEDDHDRRARIHADLGLTAHERGDPAAAAAHARRAQELAERSGDRRILAHVLNVLGVLARADGDTAASAGHLERSVRLALELDDPSLHVAALNNLAQTRAAEGDADAAIDLTREALGLCAAQGDRHREAALHNNLADLLHDTGRPEEAMEHLKRAVALFAEVGADEAPRPEIWKLVSW